MGGRSTTKSAQTALASGSAASSSHLTESEVRPTMVSRASLRNVGRFSREPLFRLAAVGAARRLPRLKKASAGAICKRRDAAPVLFDRAASAAGPQRRLDSCGQELCGCVPPRCSPTVLCCSCAEPRLQRALGRVPARGACDGPGLYHEVRVCLLTGESYDERCSLTPGQETESVLAADGPALSRCILVK